MIEKKQRTQLIKIATACDSVYTVGKLGINDNLIQTLSDALDAKELIKITVLKTAPSSTRGIGEELAEILDADLVTVIGFKVVLYRKSKKENIHHILED